MSKLIGMFKKMVNCLFGGNESKDDDDVVVNVNVNLSGFVDADGDRPATFEKLEEFSPRECCPNGCPEGCCEEKVEPAHETCDCGCEGDCGLDCKCKPLWDKLNNIQRILVTAMLEEIGLIPEDVTITNDSHEHLIATDKDGNKHVLPVTKEKLKKLS